MTDESPFDLLGARDLPESAGPPMQQREGCVRRRRTSSRHRGEDWTNSQVREYRATGDRRIRNLVVEENLHLADYHVRRFSHSRGVNVDDLQQVAFMAIIHAVERFDPDRGVTLRTFASRTIEGELKRHLRDGSWAVRPPRRLQDLHLRIRGVAEELTHELGRQVTPWELADRMDMDVELIIEGLDAGRGRTAESLDLPDNPVSATSSTDARLATTDVNYELIDDEDGFEHVLSGLDPREREVLKLRFVDEMSQPQIAESVGVSQSYVSRILKSSLGQLRGDLAKRSQLLG
ncbi:MAG TPA: sigma-70 family RNA polymerase sigma factor [Microthrixaceae bacterium]|nr:sigma-70 family RNA polymerase sigma factor [Microthrixaceae bacterium]